MSVQPDLILQLAQRICPRLRCRGAPRGPGPRGCPGVSERPARSAYSSIRRSIWPDSTRD